MSYDDENSEEAVDDANFKLEDGVEDMDEPLLDDDMGLGDDDPDNRYH